MKQLFCTATHLLLMDKSAQLDSNPYRSNAKDLGVVLSYLPLKEEYSLKGVPLMPIDDFRVIEYINFNNKIALQLNQGSSTEIINYFLNIEDLKTYFKGTILEDLEYFFLNQSRANILDNLTKFINAIKDKYHAN